jgi:hypothetical protein
MARNRKPQPTAAAPADGNAAPGAATVAPSLDKLEADTATGVMPNPDGAAAKLSGTPAADDGDQDSGKGAPSAPRGKRGPRKGTRYRPRSRSRAAPADDDSEAPSTTRRGRETYADVVAQRDQLRSDAEARASVDLAHTIAQLEKSLAGTVVLAGEIVAQNGAPAWQLSEEQGATIGKLWAPILAPYMSTLGAAAPVTMALIQTGMVLLPNWKEHRRLANEPKADAPALSSGQGE